MTQVTENDHLFGSAAVQKISIRNGSSLEGSDVADGTSITDLETLVLAEESFEEYVDRQPVDLVDWRAYVAAANAGAFDFDSRAALAECRRRREANEARELREERRSR